MYRGGEKRGTAILGRCCHQWGVGTPDAPARVRGTSEAASRLTAGTLSPFIIAVSDAGAVVVVGNGSESTQHIEARL